MPEGIATKAREATAIAQRLSNGTPNVVAAGLLKRLCELYPGYEFTYAQDMVRVGLYIIVPMGHTAGDLPKGVMFAATRIWRRQQDGSLITVKNLSPRPFEPKGKARKGLSRWQRLRKPVV